MSDLKELNLNDIVYIKLNDMGREVLKKRHEELYRYWPHLSEYKEPKVDNDGFSKFQLHTLMNMFGHLIIMGRKLPFDTTIKINIKESNNE